MARPVVFDPTPYMRPPRVDVRQCISLAIALLSAYPKTAEPRTKKAAQRLRKATRALQNAWRKRQRAATPKPGEKVKADRRIDTAWGALKARLEAYGWLPAEQYSKAPRAAQIVVILFPTGLDFLTLPMDIEWFESNERLKRIEEDNLGAEIDDLAGPAFLAEVRAAHAHYGTILGITRAQPVPADVTALLEPLRAAVGAMGDYMLQIVAGVDREDPETVAVARAALLPIDRFRADAARRAAEKPQTDGSEQEADDAGPDEELPVIDPDDPEGEQPK